MKFSEIKKFPHCNYVIDTPLDSLDLQLNKFARNGKLIMNPDFQRGHVWTKKQQISYMEYLLKEPTRGHATTLTFNSASKYNSKLDPNLYCLDGLQRYTAIKRFLNNEIKTYDCYFKDFEDKNFLLNHTPLQIAVFNFETKKEILEYYLMFNSGGTVHSKAEIDKVKKMIEELPLV